MLSFMREQGAGDLPGSPDTGSGPRHAGRPNQQDSQEYLTVAANSKNLRRSTILVMILVAIGLAGLGYMIRKSQPQAAVAQPVEDEGKIEAAISRLTGVRSEMVSRMDEIVKRFYEFSDVFQVEVGELVKNPFEVEVFTGALEEEINKAEDEKAKAALIQREHLKQRASALKLLSVMRSDQGNCCMIDDRILQQGDVIEGFTITRISGDSVELACRSDGRAGGAEEADILRIELKLSQ
jgi:hypothetical protein